MPRRQPRPRSRGAAPEPSLPGSASRSPRQRRERERRPAHSDLASGAPRSRASPFPARSPTAVASSSGRCGRSGGAVAVLRVHRPPTRPRCRARARASVPVMPRSGKQRPRREWASTNGADEVQRRTSPGTEALACAKRTRLADACGGAEAQRGTLLAVGDAAATPLPVAERCPLEVLDRDAEVAVRLDLLAPPRSAGRPSRCGRTDGPKSRSSGRVGVRVVASGSCHWTSSAAGRATFVRSARSSPAGGAAPAGARARAVEAPDRAV